MDHVLPVHIRRYFTDIVNISGQESRLKKLLNRRYDSLHMGSQPDTADDPKQGAENADDYPLNDKDAHDIPRGKPKGPEYSDVRLFIRNYHDQCGDDVEGGHGDDQSQDHKHHS